MAHYAEIIDGVVNQVLVLDSNWSHEERLEWLNKNVSTNEWIRTKYDSSIRNKYAGRGDEYHKDIDAFVSKKPYPSWKLDKKDKKYKAPKPEPETKEGERAEWDEKTKKWKKIENEILR